MNELSPSNTRPRVSVVIPTYNQAKYIGQAIASVRDQTFTDWELIIIDDGSTDATAAVVAQQAVARLRYVARPKGERSRARNAGLELAQGELVAFLDDDDFWAPDYLARQVANFAAHPELGLSFTGAYDTDPTGKVVRARGLTAPGVQQGTNFLARNLLGNRVACTSVTMVPIAVLRAVGGFDNNVIQIEDWDLWLRIAMRYAVASIPEPLVYFRRYHTHMPRRLTARHADIHSLHILEKNFATLTDPALLALRPEGLGTACWRGAWNCYMLGDFAGGQAWLAKARDFWPGLFAPPYQIWVDSLVVLADELYDIFTPVGEALDGIDRLFDNLPAWAAALRPLRTAAKGRYCGLAVFSSYSQGRRQDVLQAAPLAIRWQPQWLLNRGFLSIWARACLGVGWRHPGQPAFNHA